MADNKLHHYVPQFYLRRFSARSGASIGVCNLKNGITKTGAAIKGQARRPHLYGENQDLEKILSVMESKFSAELSKVTRKGAAPPAGSDAEFTLRSFILNMNSRTLKMAEVLRHTYGQSDSSTLDPKDSGISLESYSVTDLLRDALRASFLYEPLSRDLKLLCIGNRTKLNFLTSDAPVVLLNPSLVNEDYMNFASGFASIGVIAFITIDQRMALALYDSNVYSPGHLRSKCTFLEEALDVHQINQMITRTADEHLYFGDHTDVSYVRELLDQCMGVRPSSFVQRKQYEVKSDFGPRTLLLINQVVPELKEELRWLRIRRGYTPPKRSYFNHRNPPLVKHHKIFLEQVRLGRFSLNQFSDYLKQAGLYEAQHNFIQHLHFHRDGRIDLV